MRKIRVNLGRRSYNIYIGYNIIKEISSLIHPSILKNPILIVTNEKINKLAGKNLLAALGEAKNRIYIKEVPDSERAKSFKTYNNIISAISKIGRKTKPAIFALGGGVVGDVSGFVASTYKRGIPYVQIPTTLVGQVDSSIGGKVAIDLPEAKNIVGSFYQPHAVICDIAMLKSLPKNEIKNGLAEVIKYGIIADRYFFEYIEKNLKNILNLKRAHIETVIQKCANTKARIVEKDELDTKGVRAILNFGHTFGHAIEAYFKYSKEITHGQAVAIGMVLASRLAEKMGIIKASEVNRIENLIKRAGLPTRLRNADIKKIIDIIDYDKKFQNLTNRFVLPKKIGLVKVIEDIPAILIKKVLYENLI